MRILMAAALIANAASQLVVGEGLYHALAKITLARFAATGTEQPAQPAGA